MSNELQTLPQQPPEVFDADFNLRNLNACNWVPDHCDVVSLLGAVLIYEDTLSRDGVVDGAFYVVEDQRPVGGMDWKMYDRMNAAHGPSDPRVRIRTKKRVVRAIKCQRHPGHWWQILPGGGHDGPFEDWSIGHNLAGRVVGIYLPGRNSTESSG